MEFSRWSVDGSARKERGFDLTSLKTIVTMPSGFVHHREHVVLTMSWHLLPLACTNICLDVESMIGWNGR